ncbi:TMEM175 family protein [Terriglobus sp.]|uniref:TMEM175 family protein n=1 Tax=Terriglobus sp. TaxID=1889013 RepID=UPI003AFFBFAB
MGLTHSLVGKDGFRLRGIEMSRVDGFSDVVFGFALTLIVASLEVPKTFSELHEVLVGFVPFAVSFVLFMMVWLSHFRFFRRFGLHDLGTILINAGLLFSVLFYVYPLKFLFRVFTSQLMGQQIAADTFANSEQIRELVIVYGLGFAAIYFFLFLLNLHAWRLRSELDLNRLELVILKSEYVDLAVVCGIGLVVAALATMTSARSSPNACFAFFLIGIWKTVSGFYFGKRIRNMRETAHGSTEPPVHEPLPG